MRIAHPARGTAKRRRCRATCCLLVLGAALATAAPPPATAPGTRPARAAAAARYERSSLDDVAWENDRIAFRVYGPALQAKQPAGSGIDVWVKSTRALVLERWFKANDYRIDRGEGLDCYSVGTGRGCGLGVWNGQSLDCSGVWASHRIVESGPGRAVAELTYAAWQTGVRKVWETRRISLDAGSNFNRIESRIDSDQPGELVIGIGINKRGGDGSEVTLDKRRARVATWQPAEGPNGFIGCGVIVDPTTLVRLADADGHYLALVRVAPGKPFVYHAGAGWSKGDFATAEAWQAYVRDYAADFVPR